MATPNPLILPLHAAHSEALQILREGGVLFLPSDTIYGFSCRISDERARERVRALKGVERTAPFLALAADRSMVDSVALEPSEEAARILDAIWPGPTTAILPARAGGTVGLRVPALGWLCSWIRELGEPIVSTSANRTGAAPCVRVADAVAEFGLDVDLYVDGGILEGGASTLLDLTDGVRVLRGALPPGLA